jgi:hypothetical protein
MKTVKVKGRAAQALSGRTMRKKKLPQKPKALLCFSMAPQAPWMPELAISVVSFCFRESRNICGRFRRPIAFTHSPMSWRRFRGFFFACGTQGKWGYLARCGAGAERRTPLLIRLSPAVPSLLARIAQHAGLPEAKI